MTCRFSTAQRATSSGCNKISTCTSSTCSTLTTLRRSWVRCAPSVFLRIELIILSRFPKARSSAAPRNVLRFHRGQAVPVGGLANTVCSSRYEYWNNLLMRTFVLSSPLPAEMLQYARSDTHFLLFIYDNLRNALLDRAQSRTQSRAESPASSASTPSPDPSIPPAHVLIREVLARSEETALRVYEREIYDSEGGSGPGGWDGLARKWNKLSLAGSAIGETDAAANVQRAIYRAAHAWRDKIAREEDESTRYVSS